MFSALSFTEPGRDDAFQPVSGVTIEQQIDG
jgi:hypothetical protein